MTIIFFGVEGRKKRRGLKSQPVMPPTPPPYIPSCSPPMYTSQPAYVAYNMPLDHRPPCPYPYEAQPFPDGHAFDMSGFPITEYQANSTALAAPVHGLRNKASKSYTNLRGQLSSQAGKSVNNLQNGVDRMTAKTAYCIDESQSRVNKKSTQILTQGAALCDRISSKFDNVLTSIDDDRFSGREQDLLVEDEPSVQHIEVSRNMSRNTARPSTSDGKRSNHFNKVWMYSNSRLPPHLPPLKLYVSTWPLLCLAASYSERVYTPPNQGMEKETHVASDWRSGTKAMVLKSVPLDDMHTVVFAIRGSATFMDWAVNWRAEPASPSNFLDDPGNLCHSGFLHVARKMIQPVADRLRALLQENPTRSHCSLLITGHSAGGAVAALLYAHMLSTTVESDLSSLTGFFKRVHCITFGAPPVSLLPLQRPDTKRHHKSLFYNFINEGDPVPRADKQVVKSLLKLYASPAPPNPAAAKSSLYNSTLASFSKLNLSSGNQSSSTLQTTHSQPSKLSKASKSSLATQSSRPNWTLPPTTLSLPARLVVLRERAGAAAGDEIEAVTVDDEMLRTVVYGDPLKHMMSCYRERVEALAVRAVTATGR